MLSAPRRLALLLAPLVAVPGLSRAAASSEQLVAARAAQLMRDAEWRPAAQRAAPEDTIANAGLNVGEVAFLAEAFGRTEPVALKDFPRILGEGRTILLGVIPRKGQGGHEIVVSRHFRHNGADWFELMDSNRGPIVRLYMSAAELETVQDGNGVAYRPDPGTTAPLLR